MARLILSDASPLIGLARVDGLGWLRVLLGTVHIPREVAAEVLPGLGQPGEAAIADAVDAGWLVVMPVTPAGPPLPELDEGEAACIRLAFAHPEPCLLLMDERAGRATAAELGLKVTGTAAVIAAARGKGLLPCARDVFAALHAAGFRMSREVVETALRSCGEWPDR